MKTLFRSLAVALVWIAPGIVSAQTTTLTIPTTIQNAHYKKIGMNVDVSASYGNFASLQDQNGVNHGYFETGDVSFSASCDPGYSQTTTSWGTTTYGTSNPFPADFFANADFIAFHVPNTGYNTNLVIGQGHIAHSTASNTGDGIRLTLFTGADTQTALTQACTGSNPNQDTIIVSQRTPPSADLLPINDFGSGRMTATGCSYNFSDVAPTAVNQMNSMECTAYSGGGTAFVFSVDQGGGDYTGGYVARYWINYNGTYTFSFKLKAYSSGASANISMGRGSGVDGSLMAAQAVTPTYSAGNGNGQGWVTYWWNGTSLQTTPATFTLAETGTQSQNMLININSITGTVGFQDFIWKESSNNSSNTSALRDAVFNELNSALFGALRWMYPSMWGSRVDDLIWPLGNHRHSQNSGTVFQGPTTAHGYVEELTSCIALNTDCWLQTGFANNKLDHTHLYSWLKGDYAGNTVNYAAQLAALGKTIYVEYCNECWLHDLAQQDGVVYAQMAALAIQGFHASPDYVSTDNIKFVANLQMGAGTTSGGWGGVLHGIFNYYGVTPDVVDIAPYTLSEVTDVQSTCPTGFTGTSPLCDEYAQIHLIDSTTTGNVVSGGANDGSLLTDAASWAAAGSQFGVYETALNYVQAISLPQSTVNGIADGVGQAEADLDHMWLQQRDAKLTAPVIYFALPEQANGYNCLTSGSMSSYASASNVTTITGTNNYLANEYVKFTVSSGPTYLNGQTLQISPTGLTTTSAQVAFTTGDASGSASGSGGCAATGDVGSWGAVRYMATGPAQTAGSATVDRPQMILFKMVNQDIGTNSQLIQTSQSGTPTYSYPGGQKSSLPSGNNSITSDAAVPVIDCLAWTNSAQTSVTVSCINKNGASQPVAFNGALAPTGNATRRVFAPSGTWTDNNEGANLQNNGTYTPPVGAPTSSTVNIASGDTLPPYSVVDYTYTVGGSGCTNHILVHAAHSIPKTVSGAPGAATRCY